MCTYCIGTGVRQECTLLPYLFRPYREHIIWSTRLDPEEGQVKYIDISSTTFLAESSHDLKWHLMKVKEESVKAGLDLNISETKTMITEEIHNFNTDNGDIEIVKDLVYPDSVIHSNGNCSQEIMRRLNLEGQQWKNQERSSRAKIYC